MGLDPSQYDFDATILEFGGDLVYLFGCPGVIVLVVRIWYAAEDFRCGLDVGEDFDDGLGVAENDDAANRCGVMRRL